MNIGAASAAAAVPAVVKMFRREMMREGCEDRGFVLIFFRACFENGKMSIISKLLMLYNITVLS